MFRVLPWLVYRNIPVIASEAQQSHDSASVGWRLLRHVAPRQLLHASPKAPTFGTLLLHGPGQPLDPGYARSNDLIFSMQSSQ
jgi:hypothetical protein